MTEKYEYTCPLDLAPEIMRERLESLGEDPKLYVKRLEAHYSDKGGHRARHDFYEGRAKDIRRLRRLRARR